jgi:alkylhydroperoxidase/carboxymuconolactone decarboxylase family protein YurZ
MRASFTRPDSDFSGNGPCLYPNSPNSSKNPPCSDVRAYPALTPRDQSIANGVALITHIAFYAGFPAAISASAIAARTLTD